MSKDVTTAPVLVPVRQETVIFYGDAIVAAQTADGTVYVPLRPLVEAIGVSWSSQLRRVHEDRTLGSAVCLLVIATPGGPQKMQALPLKLLPGWLFGIRSNAVRADLQEKVERYKADCYEVLWQAFKGEILAPAALPGGLTPAEQALAALEAATALARQQVEYERKFTAMADYMRGHVRQTNAALRDHESRLSALELHVGPAAVVDEAQAAQIAHRVKDIALVLGSRDGANHYAAVYDALYRAFNVTSYKTIPRARFADALAWLDAWWGRVQES